MWLLAEDGEFPAEIRMRLAVTGWTLARIRRGRPAPEDGLGFALCWPNWLAEEPGAEAVRRIAEVVC